MKLNLATIIIIILNIYGIIGDNFYKLLEIPKHATDQEIRKAFKRKALRWHPDKNPDDPEAAEKFIKFTNAYDVLRNETSRKKYDLKGEEEKEDRSHDSNYHSWNYYHDKFGVYDDDIEIIMLNNADFEQYVLKSNDIWFINFYHPECAHCHTIAPIWRKVAHSLKGVVRIGAVNCGDAFFCSSQGIESYPTLSLYPKKKLYAGDIFDKFQLIDFVLKDLNPNPYIKLSGRNWSSALEECSFEKPWLVIPRNKQNTKLKKIKLEAIFDKLVCLGEIDCLDSPKLCSFLKIDKKGKFYESTEKLKFGKSTNVESTDLHKITNEVLALLPDVPVLTASEYKVMKTKLQNREIFSCLIIFSDKNNDVNLEFRKLPSYLKPITVVQVRCDKMKTECDELSITKTPSFFVFKAGGGYEIHQGRSLAKDIATFARDSASAIRFQILTPKEFPHVLHDDSPWFIDFFISSCPSCMKLLSEFREASRLLDADMLVNFGSIDCTIYSGLCQRYSISQYPSTILYNKTVAHEYHGQHKASHLMDFVRVLYSNLIILDEKSYLEKITHKPKIELWIINYYFHTCTEMPPEYWRFARLVSEIPNVFVAQIDCAVHRSLCHMEGIREYPTIKLYPSGSIGTTGEVKFNGQLIDADTFKQWLPFSVISLDDKIFEEMLRDTKPWLINFYIPWCKNCHDFALVFEDITTELKGQINFGKVDCQNHEWVCRSAGIESYPTVMFYHGVKSGQKKQSIRAVDMKTTNKMKLIRITKALLQERRTKYCKSEL